VNELEREMERLRGTVRARSSITGRWVALKWALRHPRTTVLSRLRCRVTFAYSSGPTVRCELPKGHPGTHLAGAQSWSS
jgi:hypothetical protein